MMMSEIAEGPVAGRRRQCVGARFPCSRPSRRLCPSSFAGLVSPARSEAIVIRC